MKSLRRARAIALASRKFGLLAGLLLGGTQGAFAAPWVAGETRVYADTCWERDSGDVAGHIIAITKRHDGWTITYSWSEGALAAPVRASSIAYDQSSGHLAFSVYVPDAHGGTATFDGLLRDPVLTGNVKEYWEETASPVTLHRTRSRHPDEPKLFCRASR